MKRQELIPIIDSFASKSFILNPEVDCKYTATFRKTSMSIKRNTIVVPQIYNYSLGIISTTAGFKLNIYINGTNYLDALNSGQDNGNHIAYIAQCYFYSNTELEGDDDGEFQSLNDFNIYYCNDKTNLIQCVPNNKNGEIGGALSSILITSKPNKIRYNLTANIYIAVHKYYKITTTADDTGGMFNGTDSAQASVKQRIIREENTTAFNNTAEDDYTKFPTENNLDFTDLKDDSSTYETDNTKLYDDVYKIYKYTISLQSSDSNQVSTQIFLNIECEKIEQPYNNMVVKLNIPYIEEDDEILKPLEHETSITEPPYKLEGFYSLVKFSNGDIDFNSVEENEITDENNNKFIVIQYKLKNINTLEDLTITKNKSEVIRTYTKYNQDNNYYLRYSKINEVNVNLFNKNNTNINKIPDGLVMRVTLPQIYDSFDTSGLVKTDNDYLIKENNSDVITIDATELYKYACQNDNKIDIEVTFELSKLLTTDINEKALSVQDNPNIADIVFPRFYEYTEKNEYEARGYLYDLYSYIFNIDNIIFRNDTEDTKNYLVLNEHNINLNKKQLVNNYFNALSYSFVETSYVMISQTALEKNNIVLTNLANFDYYNSDNLDNPDLYYGLISGTQYARSIYNNNDTDPTFVANDKTHIIIDGNERYKDVIPTNISTLEKSIDNYRMTPEYAQSIFYVTVNNNSLRDYFELPDYYALINNTYINIKDLAANDFFTYIISDHYRDNNKINKYYGEGKKSFSNLTPLTIDNEYDKVDVTRFLMNWDGEPKLYTKQSNWESVYVYRNGKYIHINTLTKSDIEELLINYEYLVPNPLYYTLSEVMASKEYTAKQVQLNNAYYEEEFTMDPTPFITASYTFSMNDLSINNAFIQQAVSQIPISTVRHPNISYTTVTYYTYCSDKYTYIDDESNIKIWEGTVYKDGSGYAGITNGRKIPVTKHTEYGTAFSLQNKVYQDESVNTTYYTYKNAFALKNDVEIVISHAELIPATSTTILSWDNSTGKYVAQDVMLTEPYYTYQYDEIVKPFQVAAYSFKVNDWTIDNLNLVSGSINSSYTSITNSIDNIVTQLNTDTIKLSYNIDDLTYTISYNLAYTKHGIDNLQLSLSYNFDSLASYTTSYINMLAYMIDLGAKRDTKVLNERMANSASAITTQIKNSLNDIKNATVSNTSTQSYSLNALSINIANTLSYASKVTTDNAEKWNKTFESAIKSAPITNGWTQVEQLSYIQYNSDGTSEIAYYTSKDVKDLHTTITYEQSISTLVDAIHSGLTYTYTSVTYIPSDNDPRIIYKETKYNVSTIIDAINALNTHNITKADFITNVVSQLYSREDFNPRWNGTTYTDIPIETIAKKCITRANVLWSELKNSNII